ncbi:MAG TPA: tetratricopeptide repeat protein, partial [Gemmatimonadales bacterium]|nr:tetratricopeptide repeat protein [Gemmatimonadales bacterium]
MAASEIEKLERMVRENPKGRLFASLADAYRKDAQYPKALEVLEAGLANHPDYVSARVVLGRVYLATGDRAKAREAFARVVQLDPESVIALKALADLAEADGQGEEALRWSGQLLTVDPGNDEALKQQERLAAAAAPVSAPLPIAEPPAD